MTYTVKEMYLTLQGEGLQAGRAAVFLRFAGCNLWSGREQDRPSAICQFCDTDFVGTDGPGGGKFLDAQSLAAAVAALWPKQTSPSGAGPSGTAPQNGAPPKKNKAPGHAKPYVICTGGEPLLQLDEALITALHAQRFEIGVETNGTIAVPPSIDWVCVSPKAGADLIQTSGDELKLVFPQPSAPPEVFETLEFRAFLLQPMDGPALAENTKAAIAHCLAHPQWRLSVQTHKVLGIA